MIYNGKYDREMMAAAEAMGNIVNSEWFQGYEQGYRQAEHELSLRWEDVKLMCEIANDLTDKGFAVPEVTIKEFYNTVIERYKEERKELDYE